MEQRDQIMKRRKDMLGDLDQDIRDHIERGMSPEDIKLVLEAQTASSIHGCSTKRRLREDSRV